MKKAWEWIKNHQNVGLSIGLILVIVWSIALHMTITSSVEDKNDAKTETQVVRGEEQKDEEQVPKVMMKKDFEDWSLITIKENDKLSHWAVSKENAKKYNIGGKWEPISNEESIRLIKMINDRENSGELNILKIIESVEKELQDIENGIREHVEKEKKLYFDGIEQDKRIHDKERPV